MKKSLLPCFRSLLCSAALLLVSVSSFASHIVGADLFYKWVGTSFTDQTYLVTVILYGNCGPDSRGAFLTLPTSVPSVCVYDGGTSYTTMALPIVPDPRTGTAGLEITPVCPADSLSTQCHDLTSAIPGIKQYVYSKLITLPHTSRFWRFIYNGGNGPGSTAGRAADITNLIGAGGTTMQLIDTLNNDPATNTRGHNSSPVLTVVPVPFFCDSTIQCYNPGAVDLYDTNYINEPSGDSMHFALVAATNGTAGCGAIGGPIGYRFPTTAASPLELSSGTLIFDSSNGQMCFHPIIQRATVVYNIEEFRNDTVAGVVHKALVGTMQREMTFTVINCHNTSPVGTIDSFAGKGDTLDGTHFYGCQFTGPFSLYLNPHEPDPAVNITITATGLPTGVTMTVVGQTTPTPHATLIGNTSIIAPGTYTFYINYADDNCPLTGSKTIAFTVQVLPVPTLNYNIISSATCSDSAVFHIVPGGSGKPWTMKIWQYVTSPGDSFYVRTDSNAFDVHMAPGMDSIKIYTSVSNQCAYDTSFVVDTPHFPISGSFVSPDFCGGRDGSITVKELHVGQRDTVRYSRYGSPLPRSGFIVPADSTEVFTGLLAGTYWVNILEGFCVSDSLGPLNLVNPPFTMGTVTGKNPTKCGFCDGIDTLFNLHPGQYDTIQYTYTPLPITGLPVTTPTTAQFISADSFVIFSGLCEGTYSNFVVNTAGKDVCSDSCCSVFIKAPPIKDSFDYKILYGCKEDTVMLTNYSAPASELRFHWDFGDRGFSTLLSPSHTYTNTVNDSIAITLSITNTKCVDTSKQWVYLNNFVHAEFTMNPPSFVCQDSPIVFTNLSTGASPITNNTPSYTWIFGDGTIDKATLNPTHIYTNSNTYNVVQLVAANTVPCTDTATLILQIDSISVLSIQATDSVICRGQAITFTGIYTDIGKTGNTWSFGDANGIANVNPVVHSYDDTGYQTVELNALYRACPNQSSSRKVLVYVRPDLYLGPDRTICPGGNPVLLSDERNTPGPDTKWLWSTGDTTAAIEVNKPGYYSTMLTINGCTSFDTVWVQKDCYMDIPNVFTPNGDGTNDYFYPRQFLTRGVTKFKMDIYNRWGQLIFETTATDGRGWDGKFNDKPQPGGVYVYLIEGTFKDGQIEHHQGNITLLR